MPAFRRGKEDMVSDDQTRTSSGRAGGSSDVGHDLEDPLRRQIAEALQPALDQFRQQMADAVRQELGQTHETDDDDQIDGGAVAGRAPTDDGRELRDTIRQQIAEALQPALDQFRQQTVTTVRSELDRALQLDDGQSPAGDQATRRADRSADGRGSSQDDGRQERSASGGRSSMRDDDRQREGDRTEDKASQEADTSASHGLQSLAPLLSKPMMKVVIALLEHQGEEWLRSQFKAAVETLFSEPRREGIQQQIDEILHSLLRASLEVVPDRAVRKELLKEAEQTLSTLIEDTFDKVFAGSARDALERHGEKAIHALVHRDLPEALREATKAVESLIRGLAEVIEEHWEQVFQILVQLIVKVLQERIGSMLKEGFAAITSVPKKEVEEKANTVNEQVRQRGTELRDALAEAVGSLQERVAEGTDQVQDRLKEGLKSAAEDAMQGDKQPGRPPSGRPPTGRPPSSRPPSGRPPSEKRATPGRAPSTRSR